MQWKITDGTHEAKTVMFKGTLPHTWKVEPSGVAFMLSLNGLPIKNGRSIVQLKSDAESVAALLGHRDAP